MKKMLILLGMMMAVWGLFAQTEVVDGIKWAYSVNDGKAIIGSGMPGVAAISTSTDGNVTIPSMLGGYPVTCIGDYAFCGCIGLTNVTIPMGTVDYARTYGERYALWPDTPATKAAWQLNFNTHEIGDPNYPGYVPFLKIEDYYAAWQIGKGMWVYNRYREPKSHVALQMAGCGEGYAEFSNQKMVSSWPRGVESVSFKARIAQAISPDDAAYFDEGMRLTDYTFAANTCFDRKKNMGFAGNASLSLFAYYRVGEGAYEARWEQVSGKITDNPLYKTEVLKPNPRGQRLVISRWDAVGNSYEETVLCAYTNNVSFSKGGYDMPVMPFNGSSYTNNMMPFCISVFEEDGTNIIVAAVRITQQAETAGKSGVDWNVDVKGDSWHFVYACDGSSKRLKGGTYGVLPSNCEGMFLNPQFRRAATYSDNTPPEKMLKNGKGCDSNQRMNNTVGFFDCYEDIPWWAVDPGRVSVVYDFYDHSRPFGFAYAVPSQTVEVCVAAMNSSAWVKIGEVPLTGFGSPGKEPDCDPTFYYSSDCKLRLQTGGELWDYPIGVAINDIVIRQWRGYNSGEDKSVAYCHTNFVFTSGWVTNGATQLSARRTEVGKPCSVRSPLLDGDYKIGEGLGSFSFTYREPDENIRLLVQIATNVMDLSTITGSIKEGTTGYNSWLTVDRLDYDALWKTNENPVVNNTKTWSRSFGYHGARGLMRVIVDPALVEEVVAETNVAKFGSIDIVAVECKDAPDYGWDWNMQSIGDYAFSGCRGLKSMAIPPSVTRIGNEAFCDCGNLNAFDFEGAPPKGVESARIKQDAVIRYNVDHEDEWLPVIEACGFSNAVPCEYHSPFTEIVDGVEWTYTIANGKSCVGTGSPLATAVPASTTGAITIPTILGDHEVASVSSYAFFGCSGLTRVTIPSCVRSVGENAFEGCDSLERLDVSSIISGISCLACRNVGAFRSSLFERHSIANMPDKNEQPLCGDRWGVQAELIECGQGIGLEKAYTPRVRLHWYVGDAPWGFENWKDVESGSAYLAQADDAERIYRSVAAAIGDSSIAAQSEAGTVVQYMLELEYQTKISAAKAVQVVTWLDRDSWTVPDWYAPVDYNTDPAYGAGKTFAAFTILDTIAPGWAWINEVNLFGTYDRYWQNSDKEFQYVELCVPAEADLTGWTVRMLEAGFYNNKVTTNNVAAFGTPEFTGTKKGNVGMASNMVFRSIGNKNYAKSAGKMSKDDGTLDGVWSFDDSALGGIFSYRNGLYFIGDVEIPFGVQLVRPTGIIEHSVVVVGTNGWEGVISAYDPTNIVALLNKNVPGSKFFYAGPDHCGSNRSVGMTARSSGTSSSWTNDWVCTPGRVNRYEVLPPPEINPASGTKFDTSLTVSMSCSATDAVIRYTVDGSTPTIESTEYKKKFRIFEKTTISAATFCSDGAISDVTVAEYAMGQCGNPVIRPSDGSVFSLPGQRVSIARGETNGVLRVTTDGSEPTMESPEYEGPFTIDETTTIKAKVFSDTWFDSEVVTATLTRVWAKVATPEIEATQAFTGSKNKVVISCATDGAAIYCTLDGSEPTALSARYEKPFCVMGSSTVKARAIKDDYLDSDVATRNMTREWSIGETMGKPDHAFTTGGDLGFVRTNDTTAALGESMRSGAIKNCQTSILSTVVVGPGTLTFKWKTSCEEDELHEWDHAEFVVDGEIVCVLDGITDWQEATQEITGEGEHMVVWRYVKDNSEFDGEDCLWVSEYAWASDLTETQTTQVPVSYDWLTQKCSDVVDEYDSYEKVAKQKALNKRLTVEQCYVAGVDPESTTNDFTSVITMEGGVPVITWKPDLEGERTYKVWGKTELDDVSNWVYPTNALHRFFKVTVEMPQAR